MDGEQSVEFLQGKTSVHSLRNQGKPCLVGGAITILKNISQWKPCSYIVMSTLD